MVARPLSALALDRSPWARSRWLVLAPHPDDETLGAGALIADAAARGVLAGTVYLTDGAGSHPHADQASRRRLVADRRQEASLSLRRLAGERAAPPVFLDWPDAAPFDPGDPGFEATVRKLAALARARAVDALAVTAGHEPHCDHAAAARLAYAVAARAVRPLAVFEYLVWAGHPPGAGYRALVTAPMPPGRRTAALMAHRSQLTPLHGDGFRLAEHQLRMAASDVLYTRRLAHGA